MGGVEKHVLIDVISAPRARTGIVQINPSFFWKSNPLVDVSISFWDRESWERAWRVVRANASMLIKHDVRSGWSGHP